MNLFGHKLSIQFKSSYVYHFHRNHKWSVLESHAKCHILWIKSITIQNKYTHNETNMFTPEDFAISC